MKCLLAPAAAASDLFCRSVVSVFLYTIASVSWTYHVSWNIMCQEIRQMRNLEERNLCRTSVKRREIGTESLIANRK